MLPLYEQQEYTVFLLVQRHNKSVTTSVRIFKLFALSFFMKYFFFSFEFLVELNKRETPAIWETLLSPESENYTNTNRTVFYKALKTCLYVVILFRNDLSTTT